MGTVLLLPFFCMPVLIKIAKMGLIKINLYRQDIRQSQEQNYIAQTVR